MLLKSVTDTISHLKEAGGLNHNPDILTSSLELYGALMRRMSEFLIGSIGQESTMLFHMAEVACLGLHCPEQPVVKSSVQFITEFTRQTHPSILQMVEKFGQTFVLSLIQVGYSVPRILEVRHIFRVSQVMQDEPNLNILAMVFSLFQNQMFKILLFG